jgi:hypothetical protein
MDNIKRAYNVCKTRLGQFVNDFKDGVLLGRTVNRRELIWVSGAVLLLGECV